MFRAGCNALRLSPAAADRSIAKARKPSGGFTLIELLVVIAIIGILASLLLPLLSKAKIKTQGIQCMNNHRQLTFAWKMYTDDSSERIPYASADDYYHPELDPYVWVLGYINFFDPSNPSNWDVNQDIARSPLWSYCGKSPVVWKCPADKSYVVVNGENRPRVRSMSMNVWLGAFGGSDFGLGRGEGWRIYTRFGDLTDPGPARTFVFLDMREDSIDVGNFATDMHGWSDQPGETGFYDLPGSYHHRAGGLSFADGHSELRRWRDDRTMPPLVQQGAVLDTFSSPYNQDVIWLQERATRKTQ